MTIILENLNGIAAIGIGIGLMTIVGQCIGAGEKEQAVYYIKKLAVLSEVVVIICWSHHLGIDEADYNDRRYGTSQCGYVFLYDDGNHDCKTNRLGSGIYPAVWTACSRRCQIFHDFVHLFHVDLPSEPVHLSLPGTGIWTDRSVDRNVYRLDRAEYCVYNPVPQKKMA